MQKNIQWSYVGASLFLVASMVIAFAEHVFAQTAVSPNYQAEEMQFGNGSDPESCSGQYCAITSIGDLGAGESTSPTGSTASFGSVTDQEPTLEVIVDPGTSNLGRLDTVQTAHKSTIIRIRNYLSDGYTLQIIGDPPKYGSHRLATPSSPTAASPGTEQFGINLAANSSPSVGAAPQQVPSNDTSYGVVEDKYKLANQFAFSSGDVVARSDKASGETKYTMSMIVNISSGTPAGHYAGDFAAVVVPGY